MTGLSAVAGRDDSLVPLTDVLPKDFVLAMVKGDSDSGVSKLSFFAACLEDGFIMMPLLSPSEVLAALMAADREAPKSYLLPKA